MVPTVTSAPPVVHLTATDSPQPSVGGIGFGITTGRVVVAGVALLAVVNVLNAIGLVIRPWETPARELRHGWLLMSAENNVATWGTSIAMAAAGVAVLLLAAAPATAPADARRWRQLAIVPFVLSLDEVASLHERMGDAIGVGLLRYGWVVPAAVILVALAVLFVPFVLRQSRDVQFVLVLGALAVVGGGVVLEAFNGEILEQELASWMTYKLTTTLEENLELAGVLFVVAGLVEIASRRGLRLRAA